MSSPPVSIRVDPYAGRYDEMPVSAWYYSHFRDAYLGLVSQATREMYDHALALFVRWESDHPLGVFAAPAGVTILSRYRDCLVNRSGLAPATVAKHLRFLRRILRKAGPQGDEHEDAFGLLPRVASVRPPKVDKVDPRTVSPEEWVAVYLAADVARPRLPRVSPAEWWRGALVLSLALGPRSGTTERIRVTDLDLDPDGPRLRFRRGDKTDKDRWKRLEQEVAGVLARLARHGLADLLPWPHCHPIARRMVACTLPDCHAVATARGRQFRRIQEAAGISSRFTFHDLRRTAGTVEAVEKGLRAAADMMDHRGTGTTTGYYVPRDLVAAEVGSLVATLLVRTAQGQLSRQKTLFEV